MILGYVLGPTVELNFRTAIMANRGNVASILHHPIALVLLAIAFFMVVWPLITEKRNKKQKIVE